MERKDMEKKGNKNEEKVKETIKQERKQIHKFENLNQRGKMK